MTVSVSALGYLRIGASDLDAWRRYAVEVLGLDCDASADALRLRMDAAPWRLEVVPSDRDDILGAGFEVATQDDLNTLAARLREQGVEVAEVSPAERRSRGVDALLRCRDPDGIAVELYHGRAPADQPFRSPLGAGFVTGEQGLGHMVLMVDDADVSRRFYVDGLGFRVSDFITLGKPPRALELTFLHCNPRHHTVALAPVPGAPKRLNHIMLQVDSLDAVGAALDRICERELPLSMGLGRHTNDHMISFYARSPSGFDIEFGYGARTVGDDWTVQHYDTGSTWGHRREASR